MIIPNGVMPNNLKGQQIIPAFIHGAGGNVYSSKEQAGRNLAIYGVLYNQRELFDWSENFWYVDNGYFNKYQDPGLVHKRYYRIIHNSWYGSSEGDFSWDRFNSLKIKLHDWRSGGKYIILIPPSEYISPIINETDWLIKTENKIKTLTDRPIQISTKKKPINWNNSIWCIVTCISNIQTTALIMGVPVITTRFTNLGSLDQIENPPKNRDILKILAHKQWTIKQMQSGQAWRELNEYN